MLCVFENNETMTVYDVVIHTSKLNNNPQFPVS